MSWVSSLVLSMNIPFVWYLVKVQGFRPKGFVAKGFQPSFVLTDRFSLKDFVSNKEKKRSLNSETVLNLLFEFDLRVAFFDEDGKKESAVAFQGNLRSSPCRVLARFSPF